MSPSTDHSASSSSGSAALRTLLITDFVSSTELIETLGDKQAAKIFAAHDRKARDILAACGGVEIDKTDGFLFLFTRPVDAVRFSLEYHDMLRSLSEEKGVKLRARAGIHVGEVILRRNTPEDVARGAKPVEVDGLSKHAAARVMSVGVGGQTLMTGTTFAFARRGAVGETNLPSDVCWMCHGDFLLKGIEEPVPLHEVGREGIAPLRPPPDGEKVRRVQHQKRGSRLIWLSATLAIVVLGWVLVQAIQHLVSDPAPSAKTSTSSPASNTGQPEAETEAEAEAQAEAEDEAEAPTTIVLLVKSDPAGAMVSLQGSQFQAPFTHPIPAEVGFVPVEVSMEGYETLRHFCEIKQAHIEQGSSSCTIKLEREARTRSDRPKEQAKENGSSSDEPPEGDKPAGYEDNPYNTP